MGVEASVLSLVVVILIKDVVVPLYRGNGNGKSNGNGGGRSGGFTCGVYTTT